MLIEVILWLFDECCVVGVSVFGMSGMNVYVVIVEYICKYGIVIVVLKWVSELNGE